MVATAHGLGLKAGWYANNCICKETTFTPAFADKVSGRTFNIIIILHSNM